MGAAARTALATAVVPYGLDAKVEADLHHMMAGAVEALQRSGRWRQVLDAGGSSREQLGRPSPAVQVRQQSPLTNLSGCQRKMLL